MAGGTVPSTLVLVDFHDHRRGGHYGAWLRWFADEFAARFEHVSIVTPRPRLSRGLFGPDPPRVSFHRLPRRLRRSFDLEALRRFGHRRNGRVHVFVMWAYDLLELDGGPPSDIPWAGLGGLSWLARGHAGDAADAERRVLELADASPTCRAIVHPDGYLRETPGNTVWVPGIDDFSLPATIGEPAMTISARKRSELSVGAFGHLYGRRCVDELLRLAKVQPDVQFVLAGKLLPETVDAELRPLLDEGALPNLLVVPGFIESEENLNAAIAAVDAVFIDGRNYPVQSGVISKAIRFGKCVLTPHSDAWTSDLIADRGVGLAYHSRDTPLLDAWRQWKESGGPDSARGASAELTNPRVIAAAFERIVERLVGSNA